MSLPLTSQQGSNLTYNATNGVVTVSKTSNYKIIYKAGSTNSSSSMGSISLQTSSDGSTWTTIYACNPQQPTAPNLYYSPQDILWEGLLSSGTYFRFYSSLSATQGVNGDITTYPYASIEEIPSATIIQPSAITVSDLISKIYPVGHILMTENADNPVNYLGVGTWSAYGAGKVPVGIDSSQTEFNTVGKTSGEKTHTLSPNEMPSHTHTVRMSNGVGSDSSSFEANYGGSGGNDATSNGNGIINTGSAGSGIAHNNLQPYVTTQYIIKY
jgi:hypothetical protein